MYRHFNDDVKTQELEQHKHVIEDFAFENTNFGEIEIIADKKQKYKDIQINHQFFECKTENYPNNNFLIEILQNIPQNLLPNEIIKQRRITPNDKEIYYIKALINTGKYINNNYLGLGLTYEIGANHYLSNYYIPNQTIYIFNLYDLQSKLVYPLLFHNNKHIEYSITFGKSVNDNGQKYYSVCLLVNFEIVKPYILYHQAINQVSQQVA